MSARRVHKASGFRGTKTDRWWTKDSKHGVRYQCSSCGRVTLGMYGIGDDERMHSRDCPRMQPALAPNTAQGEGP